MPKKTDTTHITLLVHSKIVVFEWGKVIIDFFNVQTNKNKYNLNVVYDISDVTDFDSPVVVFGVDGAWLDMILEELNAKKCRVILIGGMANKKYEYVSHISSDHGISTKKALQLLWERDKKHPALFGIQKNDTSDQTKSTVFSEYYPTEDIYCVENEVSECFNRFYSNIDKYDSVICANDVMAIYLLSRFHDLGVNITEKLYLIGNGNLWLGAHVTPKVTTVYSNSCAMVQLALQIFSTLCEFDDLDSINASASTQLIPRESTGDTCELKCGDILSVQRRSPYVEIKDEFLCPELLEIVTLDRKFSACSQDQMSVLSAWISGASIDEISERLYISEHTVKYHLKTIYKILGIHSKNELLQIVNKYGLTI